MGLRGMVSAAWWSNLKGHVSGDFRHIINMRSKIPPFDVTSLPTRPVDAITCTMKTSVSRPHPFLGQSNSWPMLSWPNNCVSSYCSEAIEKNSALWGLQRESGVCSLQFAVWSLQFGVLSGAIITRHQGNKLLIFEF
jgi:hypothetical protein